MRQNKEWSLNQCSPHTCAPPQPHNQGSLVPRDCRGGASTEEGFKKATAFLRSVIFEEEPRRRVVELKRFWILDFGFWIEEKGANLGFWCRVSHD
jgi:hypothetical protein